MALLGVPYRIMYLSRGPTTGLTDVKAVVLKPDKTVVGVFPLEEAPGLFAGCYIYDYYTSITDPEGDYFSLVVSPSESGWRDIVRFEMSKPGSGGAVVIPPTNLVATIVNDALTAVVREETEVWSSVKLDEIRGLLAQNKRVTAVVSDTEVMGDVKSNSTIAVTEGCP